MKQYEVAILGAGTAGLSARREVAKVTNDYIVLDDGILGTTCARVGCMPSKVMIEVANLFHKRADFAKIGISGAENLRISHVELMKHVRSLRDRFVRAVIRDMDEWQTTHLVRKRATFLSPHELDLGDERIRAKKIIIATGSKPVFPDDWLPYRKFFIDTDSFFELETLPETVAVIGTGVIGLELGQALCRLGVKVVAIGRGDTFGGLTDPEIRDYARMKVSDEMPVIAGGVESVSEKKGKLAIKAGGKEHTVNKALLAMGRNASVAKLGLEKIGVELQKNGQPHFDLGTHRIKGTSIYIAGDASNERPILHEAADEGAIVGFNAARSEDHSFRRRVKISITFSSPNIAVVGKSYRALVDGKVDFVTGSVSFEGQGRSIVKLEEKGMLKIYGHRKTGHLLGAELFAPAGEHLAHLLAWAMDCDLTVYEALSRPFYHPTVEEGVRTALRNLAKMVDVKPVGLELVRSGEAPAG